MTPGQCRAARGLLEMTQADLAAAAGVGLSTVKDFELGKRDPLPHNLAAIVKAITVAGIQLIPENGAGAGVRMAKRAKPKGKAK